MSSVQITTREKDFTVCMCQCCT